MKSRLSLFAAIAVLFFASFSPAQNCGSIIEDRAGVITNPSIITNAARTLTNQGADVKVVTVDSVAKYSTYGNGLVGVEAYFEQSCAAWRDSSGQRKANLFVIMVAPNDRAKNIFLGSYYNGAFDVAETYSRLANSSFHAKQWEMGIAATLNGTANRALAYHQRMFAAQQRAAQQQQRAAQAPVNKAPSESRTGGGLSGLAIFLLVIVVLSIIMVILYFMVHEAPVGGFTSADTYVPPPQPDSYRDRYPRHYASAAPSQTVVVDRSGNDGLLTGVLIGEALSRPSQPNPQPSSYAAPEPVRDAPEPAPEPVQADAPDSTWEEPTQSASSYDPPSTDTDFGGGSNSDSGF